MNLTSLDAALRALTPSEQKYKSKQSYFSYDGFPKIDHHGKSVYLLKFGHDASPDESPHDLIYIKKQSRYQDCPEHIHNWIEISYMYSGQSIQIINDISYTMKRGQVMLIDTETPHYIYPLGDNDIMINLVINKKYLSSNFFNRLSSDSILSSFFINAINDNTSHDNFILFHSEKSRKLPLFFNELLCELYDPSISSSDMINSLLTLVVCELINVYENDLETSRLQMKKNSISPILRYIEGNYQSCSLESTARFFNMNPNYLTTLLKQHTGSSYKQLIQKQRLTKAGQLLRNTELSISDVANSIGYENINFFYKKFWEQYHCSPKSYREQNSII